MHGMEVVVDDILQSVLNGMATGWGGSAAVWVIKGTVLGMVLGGIPGIGSAAAMALLLPFVFAWALEPTVLFLAGLAVGSQGGHRLALVLRRARDASALRLSMAEGQRMGLHGQAAVAAVAVALSMCLAGVLGVSFVVVAGPWVASAARPLGPAATSVLMLMALTAVGAAVGARTWRAVLALALGLVVAVASTQIAWPAWSGGDVVLMALGVLVVSPALEQLQRGWGWQQVHALAALRVDRPFFKRWWRPSLRGCAIGLPLGCVPLGGAHMPADVSYATERVLVRPQFRSSLGGRGAIEGVAGPAAATASAMAASLLPLLALGLPTTASTAVMLGAFNHHGLWPGPQWFDTDWGLVGALLGAWLLAHALLLVLSWPLLRGWMPLLRVPSGWWQIGLLCTALVAAYGLRQQGADVLELLVWGLVGGLLRRAQVPATPLLVGAALGPWLLQQWQYTMAVSGGSWWIFWTDLGARSLLLVLVLAVAMPPLLRGWLLRRMVRFRQK